MAQLLTIAVSALLAGLMVGLLVRKGYSARLSKVSLPFVDWQVSNFSQLSAVQFFTHLSVGFIGPELEFDNDDQILADRAPILLIHVGWNLVSGAFIRRFNAYPSDDRVEAAAGVIGGQNVEFLKMYRDIHAQAIRHAGAVTREFAANYLLRAPSLATRIEGIERMNSGRLIRSLLLDASETVRKN